MAKSDAFQNRLNVKSGNESEELGKVVLPRRNERLLHFVHSPLDVLQSIIEVRAQSQRHRQRHKVIFELEVFLLRSGVSQAEWHS